MLSAERLRVAVWKLPWVVLECDIDLLVCKFRRSAGKNIVCAGFGLLHCVQSRNMETDTATHAEFCSQNAVSLVSQFSGHLLKILSNIYQHDSHRTDRHFCASVK